MRFPIQIPSLDDPALAAAVERRWNSLTKPPGSLGRLESLLLRLALIQGRTPPHVERRGIAIFCADHGVTEEGVSAYPREVTAQMVKNFLAGGAAISVLCRQFKIDPVVVDTGVAAPLDPGVVDLRIARGTANLAREAAMSVAQAEQALHNGVELAREWSGRYDIAAVGEMGIGNTTPASALLCAFTGIDAARAAGPGAGLDKSGVSRKTECLRRALALHRGAISAGDPLAILAALGGFEIATMTGFLLGAAERRLPVVVDGFISTSAALAASRLHPRVLDCLLFAHASAEPAHADMLSALGAEPVLNLGMRLGEGSGAGLLFPLLDASLALYTAMATFQEASVHGAL